MLSLSLPNSLVLSSPFFSLASVLLTLNHPRSPALGVDIPLASLPHFSPETALPLAAFPSISQDLSFRKIFCGYRLWFGLSTFVKRNEPFPSLHEYTGQQHFLEGALNFYNLLWYVVLTPF